MKLTTIEKAQVLNALRLMERERWITKHKAQKVIEMLRKFGM